jgi:hypothetical protein
MQNHSSRPHNPASASARYATSPPNAPATTPAGLEIAFGDQAIDQRLLHGSVFGHACRSLGNASRPRHARSCGDATSTPSVSKIATSSLVFSPAGSGGRGADSSDIMGAILSVGAGLLIN